jgi:trigger factor
MKKTLDREGSNVVKVGLEIEAEKAMKAYEVACRQVSHRLNIPGFRRGKAPRNIVERAVGVDFLKKEALENLVPEALGQVIMDEKLDIITEPQVDSYEFELGEPLRLNAHFEVRPEVKLGNFRGLKIEVPEAKLPADALEKALERLAESRSTLKTIEPRPAAMDDTLLINFECFSDGKLVEGGKAEGLLIEMKEGNFLPGFCEQLVGKMPESEFEVMAKFPETYRNTELAGKDAQFKVNIIEVRTRVVPEINEEFAKTLGQESLESLNKALAERLDAEIKGENEARCQKLVVDAVVAAAEVAIPDSMVERETNLLIQHLKRIVEERGNSWEAFVNSKEYPDIYKERKEEARQRVLTSLVLGAVVRSENMIVAEEEAAPFLAELVSRYNVPVERIKQDEQVRRAFEQLSRQAMEEALTRKVVDFLQSQSEINFVADGQETEAKPPEEVQSNVSEPGSTESESEVGSEPAVAHSTPEF